MALFDLSKAPFAFLRTNLKKFDTDECRFVPE